MKDKHLLTDIRLEGHHRELRPLYRTATSRRRLPQPGKGASGSRFYDDFATASGRENLAQAVVVRLLTPLGELAALHPDYGSKLPDLIGSENTAAVRHRAKGYILQSLAKEPRIAEVVRVSVEPHPVQRDRIDIELELRPEAATEPAAETISIGPFALRLTP